MLFLTAFDRNGYKYFLRSTLTLANPKRDLEAFASFIIWWIPIFLIHCVYLFVLFLLYRYLLMLLLKSLDQYLQVVPLDWYLTTIKTTLQEQVLMELPCSLLWLSSSSHFTLCLLFLVLPLITERLVLFYLVIPTLAPIFPIKNYLIWLP